MKKLIFVTFSIVVMLIQVGCANLGDKNIDIGSGFVYQVDGDQRWIRADNIMKDGIYSNVVDYASDSLFIIAKQQPLLKGFERLLSQDLRFRYQTILENNIPTNDPFYKRFINSHLWNDSIINVRVREIIKPNNESDFAKFDQIADSLIKFDPYYKNCLANKYNYWIIRKGDDEIFGPLSKQEYLNLRKRLKIANSTILKVN